jgi:site-specific DNA-methyltransferase (adenine-specific)
LKHLKGDCKNIVATFPTEYINLIVTSPPYAGKREAVKPKDYIPWFLERSEEFKRILKPTGSFILNIKEGSKEGQKETYVIELILELKKQGWLWVEDYIWYKPNAYPGKWPNRFRDAWEHCFHLTKQKQFDMYQEEVMTPIGEWAKTRLNNLSKTDLSRHNSDTGSGLSRKVANWVGRNKVYPDNVLRLSSETSNKNHSATFPKSLPTWFIKLLTKEGDLVLDPFEGSGTTGIAARELKRNYIGIDINAFTS